MNVDDIWEQPKPKNHFQSGKEPLFQLDKRRNATDAPKTPICTAIGIGAPPTDAMAFSAASATPVGGTGVALEGKDGRLTSAVRGK